MRKLPKEEERPLYIDEGRLRVYRARLETAAGRAGYSVQETNRIVRGFLAAARTLDEATTFPPDFFDLSRRIGQIANTRKITIEKARQLILDHPEGLVTGYTFSVSTQSANNAPAKPSKKVEAFQKATKSKPKKNAEEDAKKLANIAFEHALAARGLTRIITVGNRTLDLGVIAKAAIEYRNEQNGCLPVKGRNKLPDDYPGWGRMLEILPSFHLTLGGLVSAYEQKPPAKNGPKTKIAPDGDLLIAAVLYQDKYGNLPYKGREFLSDKYAGWEMQHVYLGKRNLRLTDMVSEFKQTPKAARGPKARKPSDAQIYNGYIACQKEDHRLPDQGRNHLPEDVCGWAQVKVGLRKRGMTPKQFMAAFEEATGVQKSAEIYVMTPKRHERTSALEAA